MNAATVNRDYATLAGLSIIESSPVGRPSASGYGHAMRPDQLSDEELVQRIREGDTDKFQLLVARYAPKIYGMAMRLTRNPADAEDALQQTFLQVFRRLNSFRGESAFGTWLYRVALNAVYMSLRQRKAVAEESFDENLPRFDESGAMPATVYTFRCNPEDAAMKAQAIQALREAIEALPPDYRAVVVARDIEELSTEETAEALGLSIAATKSRLHRARLFLRDRLEKRLKSHAIDAGV